MKIKYMDNSPKAAFLPYHGEFGWHVLHFMRYVHAHPATSKVVCCQKGEEYLYPSATAFVTDWTTPIKDHYKQGDGCWKNGGWALEVDRKVRAEVERLYPDHAIVKPHYDCHWHTSDAIKFKPTAPALLPKVDVVIAVRRRSFVPETNFAHWDKVIASLRSVGLRVGLLGKADTSFTDLTADAYAWKHENGATAGTIDLLSNCRLYIGTDTGVSHLAALMDTPMLVWYMPHKGSPNMLGLMKRANKVYFRRLADGYGNPDEIVGAAIRCLAEQPSAAPAASSVRISNA